MADFEVTFEDATVCAFRPYIYQIPFDFRSNIAKSIDLSDLFMYTPPRAEANGNLDSVFLQDPL
jgi:hypothetical protein